MYFGVFESASLPIVEALIKAGADVEARDNDGATPLHYAASYSVPSVLESLIAFGANIEARNNDGATPLHFAVTRHRSDTRIIRDLIGAGANIEARDNDGATPLHIAAFVVSYIAVFVDDPASPNIRALIEAGADVAARNNDGETPLYIARKGWERSPNGEAGSATFHPSRVSKFARAVIRILEGVDAPCHGENPDVVCDWKLP